MYIIIFVLVNTAQDTWNHTPRCELFYQNLQFCTYYPFCQIAVMSWYIHDHVMVGTGLFTICT